MEHAAVKVLMINLAIRLSLKTADVISQLLSQKIFSSTTGFCLQACCQKKKLLLFVKETILIIIDTIGLGTILPKCNAK